MGEDGHKLAEFWLSIMDDPMRRDSDRLEASKLLADRGWGKAAVFAPQEGVPLDWAQRTSGRRSCGWQAIQNRTCRAARERQSARGLRSPARR